MDTVLNVYCKVLSKFFKDHFSNQRPLMNRKLQREISFGENYRLQIRLLMRKKETNVTFIPDSFITVTHHFEGVVVEIWLMSLYKAQ